MIDGVAALRKTSRARWLVPVVLVVTLSLAELGLYVFDYLPRKLVYGEATVRLNEVVDIIETFDAEVRVWYFSSLGLDISGTDVARYQLGEARGMEYVWEIARWREVVPPGEQAFLIAPERIEEVGGTLVYEIPGGEMRVYRNARTGQPLVFAYFVKVEWRD
jgi:hypothetical protein